MTSIDNALINALLADGTYADDLVDGLAGSGLAAVLRPRMTETLADYISGKFSVVTHVESSEVFGSGFDATVWRRNTDGAIFVSMQGTTGPADFLVDVDLTAFGAARAQFVDMVNWWMKLTTPTNAQARQIREISNGPRMGPNGVEYFELTTSVPGTGKLPANTPIAGVNGHSLGGHLASAFTRIFGGTWGISHTNTFNSAGFTGNSENIFRNLQDLLGTGMGRYPNVAEQSNFFAANGISVTTNTFYFNQIGQRIPLFNEEGTAIPNHLMYKLTDSLALMEAMSRLDPTLSFERANYILSQGGITANSLERTLDALNRLLVDPFTQSLPVGDEGFSPSSRVAFHSAVRDFNARPDEVNALAGKLTLNALAAADALGYASLAKADFARFIELSALSPVQIDAKTSHEQTVLNLLQAIRPDAFSAWTADKNARLYGDTSKEFDFTDRWYSERSTMLSRLLASNATDKAVLPRQAGDPESLVYIDRSTDTRVVVGRDLLPNSPSELVLFGTDSADTDLTLAGGSERDRIFGGAGNDTLYGYDGADYLEGGRDADELYGGDKDDELVGGADDDRLAGGNGSDTLRGGAGHDRYDLYTAESGVDTIIDSDNSGQIYVDGAPVTQLNAISAGVYESAAGPAVRIVLSDAGDGSKTATVSRKSDGKLLANIVKIQGSTILDYTLPAPPTRSPDASYIRTNDPDNFRVWYLQGNGSIPPPSSGTAFVDGGGGNDFITSGTHRTTEMVGGLGNDQLISFRFANPADDATQVTTMSGGAGSDFLRGMGGTIYVDGGDGSDFVETTRHIAPRMFQMGRDASNNLIARSSIYGGAPLVFSDLGNAIALRQVSYSGYAQGYDPAYSRTFFNFNRFTPGTYSPAGAQRGDGVPSYYVTALADTNGALLGFDTTTDPNDPRRVTSYTLADAPADKRVTWIDATIKNGSVVKGALAWNFTFEGTAAEIAQQQADAKLDGSANENGFAYATLGSGNDIFAGGSGRDVVDGGADNDQIDGGGGEDILQGGGGNDFVTGGRYNDVLDGGEGADKLFGGGESDMIYGGIGNDLLYGEYDFATAEPAGNDRLDGGEGDDFLDGGAGADTLFGGDGNDLLVSDGKDALLDGGSGDDVISVRDEFTIQCQYISELFLDTRIINEILAGGHDTLRTNYWGATLPDNVEDLVVEYSQVNGGTIAETEWRESNGDLRSRFVGNLSDNVIDARAGKNYFSEALGGVVIDGGGGADRMLGGIANDNYIVDNTGDVIEEYGGAASTEDRVTATLSWTLGANLEELELKGSDAIEGTGNDQANVLQASGNAAANTLRGGLGNDTYIIGLNDVVVENAASGNDTVIIADGLGATGLTARVSDYANIENLYARLGSGVETVLGDAGANTLIGAGVVDGGEGDDTLLDVNYDDYNTIGVQIGFDSLALPNVQATLLGGAGNDTLTSISGSSTLDGGTGNDRLNGYMRSYSTKYVFGIGYGADIVDDLTTRAATLSPFAPSGDVIRLTPATDARQLRFARSTNDLVLSLSGSTDTLTVKNFWSGGSTVRSTVDTIEIAGGATLNLGSIQTGLLGGTRTTATAGADLLIAPSTGGTLSGNGGDDHLIGSGLADTLQGGAGNDYLSGGNGNDTLDGGTGDDFMQGGSGDDIYIVDSLLDGVSDTDGNDTIRASVSADLGYAPEIENLELTGTGSIDAIGNALNNRLRGNTAANVLDGSWGADDMAGGAGDDTYIVADFGDLVTEVANEGIDTVEVSETYFTNSNFYALGANVENLVLTGTGGVNGIGNALNNYLLGNAGDNRLEGLGGVDVFEGGQGSDTLVSQGQGSWFVFNRGDGQDFIINQATAVTALGTLELGAGIVASDLDYTRGGTEPGVGADDLVVRIKNSPDFVVIKNHFTEQAGVRTAGLSELRLVDGTTLFRSALDSLAVSTGLGGGGSPGTPPSIQNVIYGTFGNDYIDLRVSNVNDYIDGMGGDDSIYASGGDDWIEGGDGSDWLYGNDGRDWINGGAGNDYLSGGSGFNTLYGDEGDDYYFVDSVTDYLREYWNEGDDAVSASVSWALGENFEDLFLSGSSPLIGIGNELDNYISGNAGDNTLSGGAGSDTIRGGAGNDTIDGGTRGASLPDSLDGGTGNDTLISDGSGANFSFKRGDGNDVIVNHAASGAASGIISLYGSGINPADVALTRGTGANANDLVISVLNSTQTITVRNHFLSTSGYRADGLSGISFSDGTFWWQSVIDANTSSGGPSNTPTEGNDTLRGTTGNDTINALGGDDTVYGDAGDDNLQGGAGSDTLYGEAGNDTLDGGTGNDTMAGGASNDTYVVDSALDVVTELAGEGTDTVQSTVTYALGSNVENLVLTGTGAINATGNTLNNTLTGNSAANRLDGGAGADTMAGGAGNDTYVVDNAGDVVTEGAAGGTDTVEASIAYTLGAELENLILTGASPINGAGNALNNTLTGNSVSNRLDGGAGADSMAGGAGNDTYVVDNAGDVVTEAAAGGTDTVESSITYTLGAEVESLVLTGLNAVNATGNALANTLTGNVSNNRLDGGAGADTMTGGAGDDTYVVDNAGDVVTEAAAGGTDTVESSITYTLGSELEKLVLTGTSAINGSGNALNNALAGNSAANRLDGGAGADSMTGGAGNDTYVVDNAGDVVTEAASGGTDTVESSVTFTLGTEVENLTLTGAAAINATGNTLANTLRGNAAANVLSGGTGADTMIGGAGDDTYVVDNAGDVITELASEGSDTVQSSVTYTLAANVENLVLTGTSALNGTGNALNNALTGNSGANRLDGGSGADTMTGGAGNDTYVVDNVGDAVVEGASGGTDTVESSITYTLGAEVENLTLTGSTAINAAGNTLNNVLTGNAAANVLTGGAGNDTLNGGAGIDEGTDRVQTALTYTLGANLENLTLTGSAAVNGTGNDLANSIVGNTANNILTGGLGNDTLNGGAGNDTMIGGLGNDTYVVDVAGDVVTELAGEGTDTVQSSITYVLGATLENLTLTGSAAINGTGNDANNTLTGNSAANVLTGGLGNDTLNGGAGADTLIGGLGNDTYVVDNIADVVTELAGEGTDTVQSGITYVLGATLENLTLTGTAVINGTGNDAANTLTGNSAANVLTGGLGNDALNGGAGADTLVGGQGNDTYTVDNVGDITTELVSEGTDLVNSSVTYTLAANVENLTLTGSTAINGTGNSADNLLTGNSAANVLTGGAGNDTLNGAAGADTLIGGAGNDTYTVDNVGDVITELSGEGTDLVTSSVTYTLAAHVDNLTLTGSAVINGTGNDLANVITGNSAANVLSGGAGNDTLTDSAGANVFVGGAGNDTLNVTSTGVDRIALARGHGADVVVGSGTAANDVLEVSNGITKAVMGLIKSGNDLVLDLGSGESVTLRNWYAGVRNVGTLKIIGDAAWVPGQSGTPTIVETLNLVTVASQFDAARAADPLLTRWPLSSATPTVAIASLSTSGDDDDAALDVAAATPVPLRGASKLTAKAAILRAALDPPDTIIEDELVDGALPTDGSDSTGLGWAGGWQGMPAPLELEPVPEPEAAVILDAIDASEAVAIDDVAVELMSSDAEVDGPARYLKPQVQNLPEALDLEPQVEFSAYFGAETVGLENGDSLTDVTAGSGPAIVSMPRPTIVPGVRNMRALLDFWEPPATQVPLGSSDWLFATLEAQAASPGSTPGPELASAVGAASGEAVGPDAVWSNAFLRRIEVCEQPEDAECVDAPGRDVGLGFVSGPTPLKQPLPLSAGLSEQPQPVIRTMPLQRTASWWDDAAVREAVAPLVRHAATVTGWNAVADVTPPRAALATEGVALQGLPGTASPLLADTATAALLVDESLALRGSTLSAGVKSPRHIALR